MDYVICPYCGEKISIELCDVGNLDVFIDECPNCEKEVEIEGRQLPYEKVDGKWEFKKLCGGCYWDELKRRREKENE